MPTGSSFDCGIEDLGLNSERQNWLKEPLIRKWGVELFRGPLKLSTQYPIGED